jgi:hypothetical protein
LTEPDPGSTFKWNEEVVMSFADKDKQTARKKGLVAGAATAGSVALIATGAFPVLGIIGLVPSALLIKDWFMFRAKRGMRF